jgi:hypothetical protein
MRIDDFISFGLEIELSIQPADSLCYGESVLTELMCSTHVANFAMMLFAIDHTGCRLQPGQNTSLPFLPRVAVRPMNWRHGCMMSSS